MKYRYTAVLLALVMLSGCADSGGGSEGSRTTEQPVYSTPEEKRETAEEKRETEEEQEYIEPFSGIEKGEGYVFGNTASVLNMDGIMFSGEDMRLSGASGSLILTRGGTETVLRECQASGINCLDGNVYFIDKSNGNKVCSVDLSGESCTEIISEPVSFLMVSDSAMIYTDMNNRLYIRENGSDELISDKNAAWVNPYGDWLIFTELDNGCSVAGYNIRTRERVKILDYGFFPAVYENSLYFQSKEATVDRIDLTTGIQETVLEVWGQKFCFIDGILYFVGSKCVYKFNLETSELTEFYQNENEKAVFEMLFACGGELYCSITSGDNTDLYRLDLSSGRADSVM